MGYMDGKTDLDLILADDKSVEEEELLLTSQVLYKQTFYCLLWKSSPSHALML